MKALAEELRPGDVFYDVGSNIGQYTLPAAKIVGVAGLVVAFEPSPEAYERLRRNIALNGLSNVRAYPLALGAQAGRANMVVSGFLGRHSRLCETKVGDLTTDDPRQLTSVVSGDAFRAAEGLRPPTAIKIDVEGLEPLVLAGLQQTLRLESCRLLCCEIHLGRIANAIAPEAVLDQIRSFGFLRQERISRGCELHVVATRVGSQSRSA